jgi:allophanate hydrolase subunit 2
LNTRIFVPENSILKFGHPAYGLRAYLSVSGGFIAEKKLGSYSQYFGITQKQTIEKGDILALSPFEGIPLKITASVKVPRTHFSSECIEVFAGPDYHLLPKALQKGVLETKITVTSQSNRMAYLLSGWEEFSVKGIITAPVQPGTVQLTPSGQCLVLMRDAQTTGGYARVLQLSRSAINIMSQKPTGASLLFKLIE